MFFRDNMCQKLKKNTLKICYSYSGKIVGLFSRHGIVLTERKNVRTQVRTQQVKLYIITE